MELPTLGNLDSAGIVFSFSFYKSPKKVICLVWKANAGKGKRLIQAHKMKKEKLNLGEAIRK